MFYLYQITYVLLILLTALIGDNVLQRTSNQLVKAIADNSTHALIGLWSWTLVSVIIRYSNKLYIVQDTILCTLIASLIDLDHFCAAKSIHLEDAVSLNRRPFLHSSTVPLALSIALLLFGHEFNSYYIQKLALIIFTAFATHHTRDAYRRGYWFQPLGSTPPLSYGAYLSITLSIPFLVGLWLNYCKNTNRDAAIDFDSDRLLIDV